MVELELIPEANLPNSPEHQLALGDGEYFAL